MQRGYIFRRENEDEIFSCDRCGSAVEFTAVEETRLKDVAAV